jgi:PAS domain S-box-containing protein
MPADPPFVPSPGTPQPPDPPRLSGYGAALLAVLVAFAARWLLRPVLGAELPLVTFVLALLTIAWRYGLGPSLLVVGLGAVVAALAFLPPFGHLAVSDPAALWRLGLFLGVGPLIGLLGEGRLRATTRARAEVERRVAQRETVAEQARRAAEHEDRARLAEASAREAVARMEVLADAGAILVPSGDVDHTLARFAEFLVPRLGDTCVITVLRPDGVLKPVQIVSSDPEQAEEMRRDLATFPLHISQTQRLAAQVAATSTGVLVENADPQFVERHTLHEEHRELLQRFRPRSVMVLPLVAAGRVLGTLGLTANARAYTRADFGLMEEFARRAAAVLAHAEAHERATRSLEHLERLNRLTGRLIAAQTADDVYDLIVPELLEAAGAMAGAVVVPSADGTTFETRRMAGYPPDLAVAYARFPLAATLAAGPGTPGWLPVHEAWQTGRTVLLRDVAEVAERFGHRPRLLGPAGDASWAAVPLRGRGGLTGLITLTFPNPGELAAADRAFLEAAAEQCALALERARAADERRAVEERLEAVLKQMPAGVIIREAPDGRLVVMNDRATEILGRPPAVVTLAEMGRRNFRRLDGTPMRPEETPIGRALVRSETTEGVDLLYETPDGERRIIRAFAGPIHDAHGAVVAAVVSFLDVTAEHASRDALAESEGRYRTLAASAPGFVWATDATGRATFVNAEWERYTGATLAELQAGGWQRFNHPDDVAALEAAWTAAVEARTQFEGEFRYRRHDGVFRWFAGRAVPLLDARGEPTMWIGTSVDIDDRRQQEDRLRWQAGLLDATHDAIITWEMDAGICYWNAGAERLYGWTAAEVAGDDTRKLLHPRRADARPLSEIRRDLLAVGIWEGELWHRTRDGREVIVSSRMVVLSRHAGAPWVLETNRDISAQRAAEEQVRRAQRLEAVGRLAGGTAHEVNNQMAVVLGFAAFVARAENLSAQQRADLGEVERAANRVATLTRQLLAFSRQQVLEPEVIDLGAEVRNAAAVLTRVLGPDIRLDVRTPVVGPWIRADRTQLAQIVINCAVNGRDAMPQGGDLTVTVSTGLPAAGGRLGAGFAPGTRLALLAIGDSGEGIPAERLGRIFEPFFTTKEIGKGSGLGLSVVEGIVAQSGGEIWVDTEMGVGTCFTFGFPAMAQPTRPVERSDPGAAAGGAGTVLVVDDEPAVRAMVARALAQAGYDALEHGSGEQALGTLAEKGGRVDLVVTDVAMPGMSGGTLAQAIVERWPAVPILFISGHSLEGANQRQRAPDDPAPLPGGHAFLQKPFTPDVLVRHVRDVLDRRVTTSAPPPD